MHPGLDFDLTGAMIEAQDQNVDIVAGATVDCQAIGTGVNEAFAK